MPLRSSSTPVVGSLLSSFSDSPNRDFDTINSNKCYNKHSPFNDHCTKKLSFSNGVPHLNLSSFSCNSSPISHSASGFSEFNQERNSPGLRGVRRARSDGNLEGLASSSWDIDGFCNSNTPTRSLHKPHKSILQTIPSLSIYNSTDEFEDEEENQKKEDRERGVLVNGDGNLERSITIGERIGAIGSGEFNFGRNGMGLIEEEREEEEDLSGFQALGFEEEGEPLSPPMYLATGLGIHGGSFDGDGGGGGFNLASVDDSDDVEAYYKRMVDEYPCHPLFLRNYAQLLQSKGDLHGAEDYYHRGTLADPGDGEIMQQYAKLVWELHQDQDRALTYFERAAQAAPEDSHVLAAHASFLWEIKDDEEEDSARKSHIQIEKEQGLKELRKSTYEEESGPVSPSLNLAAGLGIEVAGFGGGIDGVEFTAANFGEGGNIEEYYKKMVEENPSNPLFLRNYAQFLYQSKGHLQGAEEYYSRAILADPQDGEIISQYAKLVWELHHDQYKASSYFERAVQATPGDCHVLGAYAGFLWETEDNEEEYSAQEGQIQVSVLQGAMASANASL
ncbi:hypothetical protein L1049_016189 [Liquidambar formosana]|uniref:Uncharacterized protein n=1 Tax=Liquidambar formosana TaxID=63359 RepID=A0AAP0S587_LIQFO